jgi:sugar phosphate isomerase/epimerase
MAGDYKIGNIYTGGDSTFTPNYERVFTGYKMSAGDVSLTTDSRTANILQEVSSRISHGTKNIEVAQTSADVLESIPKQHLKEVNRLAKLTGVELTLHAPIVEASGFTREGYSEESRNAVERQILSAIEKGMEINPQGNSPITFHSSAMLPGSIKEAGSKEPGTILLINQETHSINPFQLKERKWDNTKPNKDVEIHEINDRQWKQSVSHLAYNSDIAGNRIESYAELAEGAMLNEANGRELTQDEKRAASEFRIGKALLDDSYREVRDLFELAHKYGSESDQKKLDAFREKASDDIKKLKELNAPNQLGERTKVEKELIENGIKVLSEISTPNMFVPLQDFAIKKSAESFGNATFQAYKKLLAGEKNSAGEKWTGAPIISIENPPAGAEFSRGEDLKKLVDATREKFVENAVKSKEDKGLGMSESAARNQAAKMIGVTWDVGHINMLRKFGYSDKDLIKETEVVAPLVKHVHLSDNFGLEHTELPMGMGNVPIREMMEKLGKQEGFKDVKKVVEAFNWWQHFKTPPIRETFEAFGSAIYSDSTGPTWSGSPMLERGYFSGYGPMLPAGNYETFGAGFSMLPAELGGARRGGEGNRMSGRGME